MLKSQSSRNTITRSLLMQDVKLWFLNRAACDMVAAQLPTAKCLTSVQLYTLSTSHRFWASISQLSTLRHLEVSSNSCSMAEQAADKMARTLCKLPHLTVRCQHGECESCRATLRGFEGPAGATSACSLCS